MVQVIPDWTRRGTAKQIEEMVGNGFKFKGTGLYLSDTDTTLVVPFGDYDRESAWVGKWDESALFEIHCYNTPFYNTIFGAGTIPTREDIL